MAKKSEYSADFRFLVRIAATDLDGKKSVTQALTGVKGVHNRLSHVIVRQAGISPAKLMGDLSDDEIQRLTATLEGVEDFTPGWMRNRQKDLDSGDDAHLIGSEIDLMLRDDLNRLKKIRSWRGLRHEKKLPVRGQRTKANGRTGMTVGVMRKKEGV
jgi:small subunit ribosomal protein S13